MPQQEQTSPDLRFSEFEASWKSVELKEIADIYDGTHQTPKYTNNGVPFVSVENINDLEATSKFISEGAFKKDFKNPPQKGDVLMTRITAGIIGATNVVKNDKPLAYYVSLALIRPKGEIQSDFLSFNISTFRFKKELNKRIIHVAFPKKINLGDIGRCGVVFPSLDEQQKIAAFFGAVDEKIAQLQKKKGLLEDYKKGCMQKLFSQDLRFKDDNGNPFSDWEEKPLEEIASIIMGTSPESKFYNDDLIGLPLIQGNADIRNRKSSPRIYTSETTKECLPSDILLSVRAPVGEVSKSEHHACIGRGMSAIRANPSNAQEFIYQYLLWFEPRWKSLSQGSTFASVNTSDIKSLSVSSPCHDEQKKIADFLSAIDDKIALVAAELGKAKTFKKGLLQQMFV